MITTSDEPRESRVVRIAILGSIVFHLLAFFIAGLAHKSMNAFFESPKDKDELVTLSQAITIDQRKKAVPRPAPAPHKAVPPVPHPQPKSVRALAHLPAPPVAFPKYERQALEKPAPAATAKPEETTIKGRGPIVKRIAQNTGSGAVQVTPPRQAALTSEQIAELDSQFRKTIAAARSQIDPMANTAKMPVTRKHVQLQVQGPHDDLRNGEGTSEPHSRAWTRNGLNCYTGVTYRFVWDDGTYETGTVPWPACWPPKQDPYVLAYLHPGTTIRYDIPPPPIGWVSPPNLDLKPYLRQVISQAPGN